VTPMSKDCGVGDGSPSAGSSLLSVRGRVREWLDNAVGNDLAIDLGRHDQLIGRIAEHRRVLINEVECFANEANPGNQRLRETISINFVKIDGNSLTVLR
jgi:hypothetical protein